MREIFKRNKDKLTDAEDRRVWGAMFDETRRRRPGWRRWQVTAPALATMAAAVVVVALVNRGPTDVARERVLAERAAPLAAVDETTPTMAEELEVADANAGKAVDTDLAKSTAGGEADDGFAATDDVAATDNVAATKEFAADRGTMGMDPNSGERPSEVMSEGAPSGASAAAPLSAEVRERARADSRRQELTQAEVGRVDTEEERPGAETTDAAAAAAKKPATRDLAAHRKVPPVVQAGQGTIRGQITDARGHPLRFAIVDVVGTGFTGYTDSTGVFAIAGLAPGDYILRVENLGFETLDLPVHAIAGKETACDLALQEIPADTFAEAISREDDEGNETLHFRGGRAGEVNYQVDGGSVGDAASATGPTSDGRSSAPRVSSAEVKKDKDEVQKWGGVTKYYAPPAELEESRRTRPGHPISVGGTDPVNGQAFDAMFFEHYGVNPFVDPQDDRFATFAVDVDNASFTLTRSYLDRGSLPPRDAVRVEEFVNAFDHGYAPPRTEYTASRRWAPSEEGTFAIHLDAAPSPFGQDLVLVRVGLKGREIDQRDRKPAALTFVVDVSGSMGREDRLELVKRALYLLLDQMGSGDEVGIVVYGSDARTVLPPTPLRYRRDIERAISSLQPEGATNAADGLRQGYAMADRAYRPDAINRVILCSDGVANVGETGAEGILEIIRREARRGIELTAVGFGMGNYNDVLMEKLANQGDGNYYYVDDIREARRVFVENLTGTLQTIARQTKIQVEFDPEAVRRYRLLGYENRDVADHDFRNDAVDAGEVGAGHEVTALFEVKLEKERRSRKLATVRIRYEDPETGKVTEEERALGRDDVRRRFEDADPTFKMDAAVAEFAEILRHSYWAKDGNLAEVVGLARVASRELGSPEDAEEIVRLAGTAWGLWPRGEGSSWDDDVRPAWEPEDDPDPRRH